MYEVTIAIPIYQVEAYIENTLLQALKQSFTAIEYLMIDDCGTDNSLQLVQSIIQTHPRGKDIHIISTKQNRGIAYVRNLAIEQARGKYIYFLDGDDSISNDCIQLLYDNATKYHTNFTAASYQATNINGHKTCYQYNEQLITGTDKLATLHYRANNGLIDTSTWNKLYNTEWLRENQIKCIPGTIHEEPDFNIQLISLTQICCLLLQIIYFTTKELVQLQKKQRTSIPIQEIENHMNSLSFRKQYAINLKNKPYFPDLALKLIKTSYNDAFIYVSANVYPSFDNNHLRQLLQLPFGLQDILSFKYNKIKILSRYILFILPITLQRAFLSTVGKSKRLLWRIKKKLQHRY